MDTMRRLSILLVPFLLAACAANDRPGPVDPAQASASPAPSSSNTATPTPEPSQPAGDPDTEPKTRAGRLAARLTNVNSNLYELLDIWLAETDGKPRGNKFESLEVLGLKKQKMMRVLVRKQRLADKVLAKLPPGLRLEAKRNIKASRDLYKLTNPVKRKDVRMKTSKADPPKKLIRYYKEAQRRFGVPWTILAAINLVESRMGRINGPSSAGALGPMQFMPATWDAYGKGDPFNPHNAIMAAGRYLAANGAPERMRDALWNYNHSEYYVNGVLAYHRQMAGKPDSYFSYYFWQVFVRTTKGDMQLTGPGSDYPH